ncbi:hypothetical protein DAPPUDRAFT_320065 [Daphnia pulex]|uniref:C1q domain-containing protein n=1 Tax=Daphnia pulex TaxID=6669 RepID=E9GNQ8_DAPPU|nr:hypothetical protein DAPPUDRAFT_320065 [Daphnia pulex]|eukprot:EFX78913.1 hypothetical protein DAPPUDRAFT_320065 [Daphnia pulex]
MVTAFCLICSTYEKKEIAEVFSKCQNATLTVISYFGFTFAADSLTGYIQYMALRGVLFGSSKVCSKFRLSPAMVRNSRLAARLFPLLTRTKWKKLYSGIADVTQGTNFARVDLQLNGVRIAQGYSHTTHDTFAHQSTLELNKGDQITLFLVAGAIHDSRYLYTNFVGWLVEEDVFNFNV